MRADRCARDTTAKTRRNEIEAVLEYVVDGVRDDAEHGQFGDGRTDEQYGEHEEYRRVSEVPRIFEGRWDSRVIA